MRPSPARKSAPEPQSWIPIESLESLPELEELLDPRYLVDSGQSRAVRAGDDGKGYVLVDSEIKSSLELEKQAQLKLSKKRWRSRHRTLLLQRKAKIQKAFALIFAVVLVSSLIGGSLAAFSFTESTEVESTTFSILPTVVPVVIEGKETQVLSVANSNSQFKSQHNLVGLKPMQDSFNREDFRIKRSNPSPEFRYIKTATINVDGKSFTVFSPALTVGELLSENGIATSNEDIVVPSKDSRISGVLNVSVVRVTTSTSSFERAIPFQTEKRNDPNLARGKTVVKQNGENGLESVVVTKTIKDGQVYSEVESSRTILKNPVNKVVLVGTKPLGTEQGKASWYVHTPGTCAHKTLPFGTIVTVRNSATGATTTCRVADRGPFGQGRILDLSKDVFAKIASTSQGVISVTATW